MNTQFIHDNDTLIYCNYSHLHIGRFTCPKPGSMYKKKTKSYLIKSTFQLSFTLSPYHCIQIEIHTPGDNRVPMMKIFFFDL